MDFPTSQTQIVTGKEKLDGHSSQVGKPFSDTHMPTTVDAQCLSSPPNSTSAEDGTTI